MHEYTSSEIWACKRPTSRDGEDAGREERVEKPVAALEDKITDRRWFPSLQACLRNAIDDGKDRGQDPCCRDNHPWSQAW